jgi:murein DD-endopeptidase MepM/ murein hydrolase activator NlpD
MFLNQIKLAAGVLILTSLHGVFTLFTSVVLPNSGTAIAQTVSCGGVRSVNFSGKAAPEGVNVRSTPGTNLNPIGQLTRNQTYNFDGYIYGEMVRDRWTNQPDYRWYKLAGQNAYVASAAIQGNAPGSTALPPSNCGASTPPQTNQARNPDTPYLPFDPDVSLTVTRAYNSHDNYPTLNKYAVDFGAAGKQVSARASRYGQVTYAGWKDGGYGNVVEVRYRDGKYGVYQHLESVYVIKGTLVAGGQGLGKIGTTGNSTGTHLHYMESSSSFGNSVPLPQFADVPNANFNGSGFSLTSQNPDNRRP